MAEVCKLVGMEKREYKDKQGMMRLYCGLQMVNVEGTVEGVIGSKVQVLSCPQSVNPSELEIGQHYQLDYQIYDTRSGKAARLVGLIPVEV